ncbi:HlyD family efflux transporter periplasmic adaptor subunit [soil metagenome]
MSKQRNDYPWIVFWLCSCVLLLSSCRLGRQATPTPIVINNVPILPDDNAVTASLSTYRVQAGLVVQHEIYTGRAISAHQQDLAFHRSGRVATVYVKDGDKVQAGDIISTLDDDGLQLDLESAEIAVEVAKVNLAKAQAALPYRRQEAELNLLLAKSRLPGAQANPIKDSQTYTLSSAVVVTSTSSLTLTVAQNNVLLAQLALDSVTDTVDPLLVLNLKRAELDLKKVKKSILDGQLKAPFAGEVRFINLPKEDEPLDVTAGAAVARLVDTSSLQIELNLPRAQLEPLREGMPVEITSANLTGTQLKGVIQALPRPFGTSPGSLVIVALINPVDNTKLNENTSVAVSLSLQSKQNALFIPKAALHEKDQLSYVVVQEGGKQRVINVAVGIVGEDQVEVIAGLEAGQEVVIGGN